MASVGGSVESRQGCRVAPEGCEVATGWEEDDGVDNDAGESRDKMQRTQTNAGRVKERDALFWREDRMGERTQRRQVQVQETVR